MKVNSIEIEDSYVEVEVEGFEVTLTVDKTTLWEYLMRCPRLIYWTMEEYFSIDFNQIKDDVQNYLNEVQ